MSSPTPARSLTRLNGSDHFRLFVEDKTAMEDLISGDQDYFVQELVDAMRGESLAPVDSVLPKSARASLSGRAIRPSTCATPWCRPWKAAKARRSSPAVRPSRTRSPGTGWA